MFYIYDWCLFSFIEYHYVYAWVKGELLELFSKLCIYNSMSFVIIKKGEIVGPKAHYSSFDDINWCSYSTNDFVFISFSYSIMILVGV